MTVFGIDIAEPCIRLFPSPVGKQEALDALTDAVAEHDGMIDPQRLREAVHQREAVMSTGIGGGIAIPHVRFDGVRHPTLGLGVCPGGIDFGALDNQPVTIIVLFAMPLGSEKEYLGLLARVMASLRTRGLREALLDCTSPAGILDAIEGRPS